MSKRKGIVSACALVAALAALVAEPVAAKDGDGVRVAGTCTKGSSAKLKLSREDGRIEVEFEVDQNRVGVPWRVVLRQNGTVVARVAKVTRAPSGSFETRTVSRDAAGTDRFVATATRSGEVCTARASF